MTTMDGHPAVHGQGTPVGRGPTAALVGAGLTHASRIGRVLERIANSLETETDFDVNYVVGGMQSGAGVATLQVPRTLHRVEITLEVDSSAAVSVAVFDGILTLANAAQQHMTTAGPGPSAAICSSSGSGTTARTYLDQSGWLTVYFTAAATTFANVRIRSLDKKQARALRA
jgi:hypothetical protein